jgi:endonuclease YncB( thermonuclease family)
MPQHSVRAGMRRPRAPPAGFVRVPLFSIFPRPGRATRDRDGHRNDLPPSDMTRAAPIRFLAWAFLLLACAVSAPSDAGDGLTIGVFSSVEIVDGDTFKVPGLGHSIRFLCIDTEETPKKGDVEGIVAGLARSWPAVYWTSRGSAPYPVKHESPFGYETVRWAKRWFRDVDSVRLERDMATNVYDFYGRFLAYVIAYKGGVPHNYNVECVRQGFSPYSGKYGFSRRFHDAFVAAQQEARAARRGIWDTASACYPDYAERLRWWDRRGEAIAVYDARFRADPRYFFLGRDGELERLELAEGRTVVVFATLGDTRTDRFPYTVELAHKQRRSASIVFWEQRLTLFRAIPWESFSQQYVYVRGRVQLYRGRAELLIRSASDVGIEPLSLD